MKTKLGRKTKAAILAWCRRNDIEAVSVRHIHPRAYVVGKAAHSCLVVAVPWVDSEPQVQKLNRETPLKTVHHFDGSLKAGDWCSTAYVNTAGWGETVAIPVVEVN